MGYRVGMEPGDPSVRKGDASVQYRVDPATGKRVPVLPATCKRGVHDLKTVGYRTRMWYTGFQVTCRGCDAEVKPDHTWTLTVEDGLAPRGAELDNTPYLDCVLFFGQRPVAWPQGLPFWEVLRRREDWSAPWPPPRGRRPGS